jgi:hypothetical protein
LLVLQLIVTTLHVTDTRALRPLRRLRATNLLKTLGLLRRPHSEATTWCELLCSSGRDYERTMLHRCVAGDRLRTAPAQWAHLGHRDLRSQGQAPKRRLRFPSGSIWARCNVYNRRSRDCQNLEAVSEIVEVISFLLVTPQFLPPTLVENLRARSELPFQRFNVHIDKNSIRDPKLP